LEVSHRRPHRGDSLRAAALRVGWR
jgi:hypothetical protein